MPGCYKDSVKILDTIAETVGTNSVLLSLMAQYTPDFCDPGYPEINRRITTFEYEKVADRARELGFDGYGQSPRAASAYYTPNFGKETE